MRLANFTIPTTAAAQRYFFPGGYRDGTRWVWPAPGVVHGVRLDTQSGATDRYVLDIYDSLSLEGGILVPKRRLEVRTANWPQSDYPTANKVDEVWSVYTDATGGTFRMRVNPEADDGAAQENITVTIATAFNAAAATVQANLRALAATVGASNATVAGAGTPGSPWVITFEGFLGKLRKFDAIVSSLTPAGSKLYFTCTTVGKYAPGGTSDSSDPFCTTFQVAPTFGPHSRRFSGALFEEQGATAVTKLGVVDWPEGIHCPRGMILQLTPGQAAAGVQRFQVLYEPWETGVARYRRCYANDRETISNELAPI